MDLLIYCLLRSFSLELLALSLHDALPISSRPSVDDAQRALQDGAQLLEEGRGDGTVEHPVVDGQRQGQDRKSTRLNYSHVAISYAVFCLKKKTSKKWMWI